jgi:hypothetical protein
MTALVQVTLTDDALFLVRVAHHLVADGIDAGLTLHDLALLVARTDEERPSPLERAIAEVRLRRALFTAPI